MVENATCAIAQSDAAATRAETWALGILNNWRCYCATVSRTPATKENFFRSRVIGLSIKLHEIQAKGRMKEIDKKNCETGPVIVGNS